MPQWLVRLEGDDHDLEMIREWLPNEDPYVVVEDGRYYLTGESFEQCATDGDVSVAANRAIDAYAGVAALFDRRFRRPAVTNVTRIMDDGRRVNFMVADSGQLAVRGELVAAIVTGPQAPEPAMENPVEVAVRAARNSPIEDAVRLWSDGDRTWPRLYRILEEVERVAGQRVNDAGWCSRNDRERFTRTANTEAAGDEARHAGGQFQPPPNPMSRDEAIEFIASMLRRALR